MIIQLQNQNIVELSFDGEGTTSEERNVAKTVVGIDACRNKIQIIKGLKLVFQNLSELLLSHNELGVRSSTLSRKELLRFGKMGRDVPSEISSFSTSSSSSPVLAKGHSGNVCSGLPFWISALPATLRVLDISNNGIFMFTECTCRDEEYSARSEVRSVTQCRKVEASLSYLRHISPNTVSLFFSKFQFPVLEVLNVSHNLLSSDIEDAKELEEEWCRVLPQVSTLACEEEWKKRDVSEVTEEEKKARIQLVQTAVQDLDLSWNEGIRCVNDFLFVSQPSHKKRRSEALGFPLRKLSLEHCGLTDFWGLSAASYYTPCLEEIRLSFTPLALSVLEGSIHIQKSEKCTKQNLRMCAESKENDKPRNAEEWLRTALLRLATPKKGHSTSPTHRLPSRYVEVALDEIFSSSSLLQHLTARVEQIFSHKAAVTNPSQENIVTPSQNESQRDCRESGLGAISSNINSCAFPRVLLTVLTHLVVQNLFFVDQLSTLMCKEILLESFYGVVKILLKGNEMDSVQRTSTSSETMRSRSDDTFSEEWSCRSRKHSATPNSSLAQSRKEGNVSPKVDYSFFYGDDHGLTNTETSPSSSGLSHSVFLPSNTAEKVVLSSTFREDTRSSSVVLPTSTTSRSFKEEVETKTRRSKLVDQAAYLQEKVQWSARKQEKLVSQLQVLLDELECNRINIAMQTKRILMLKEKRKHLIATITENRAKAKKRHMEVLHSLSALQFRLQKRITPVKKPVKSISKRGEKASRPVHKDIRPHRTRSEVLREASAKEKRKRFVTRHPFAYSPTRFSSIERMAEISGTPDLADLSVTVTGDDKHLWTMQSHAKFPDGASECSHVLPPPHAQCCSAAFSPLSDPPILFCQSSSQPKAENLVNSSDSKDISKKEVQSKTRLIPSPLGFPRLFTIGSTLFSSSNQKEADRCEREKRSSSSLHSSSIEEDAECHDRSEIDTILRFFGKSRAEIDKEKNS